MFVAPSPTILAFALSSSPRWTIEEQAQRNGTRRSGRVRMAGVLSRPASFHVPCQPSHIVAFSPAAQSGVAVARGRRVRADGCARDARAQAAPLDRRPSSVVRGPAVPLSPDDCRRIGPFVSSLEGDVFVVAGLSEEAIAALVAFDAHADGAIRQSLARLLATA